MKLRYIFASIIALLGMATACEQEQDLQYSDLKVSTSYVSFPAEGGNTTIKLDAQDAWAFEGTPDWITVSPASGTAGNGIEVKLTATAANETREAAFAVKSGSITQYILAIQMTEKTEPVITPIADVIAAGAGNFRIKGMITKVVNTQYGNFYVQDDSGEIYVYGVKNAQGQYPMDASGGWDSFGIGAGDVVTLDGPYKLYGDTPELVDAAIVAVEKSLIDVEAFEFSKIPAEGLEFELKVTAKVSPLLVTTDADWLKLSGISADGNYKLTAAANDYTAERTATITIEGPGALKTVSVTQEGIPATGATITEIVAMADGSQIETLESTVIAKSTRGIVVYDGTTALYVYDKEKFAETKVGDNVKVFGKKTTYNGVPEITDVTELKTFSSNNAFEVPAPTDITANAADYTAAKAEYIKLTGTLAKSGNYYNITLDAFPEGEKQGSINYPVEELGIDAFDGKKITVTGWFNGLSSEAKFINLIATKVVEFVDNPKGTATNPYTASEIAAEIIAGNIPEEDVYIKGIVSAVLYTASASYPTATFWISDDGKAYGVSEDKKTTTDAAHDFECYSVKWFNNADWAEGNGQVTVGDEVIVCGKTTSYNGVAETSSKKAWLYSVNYVKTAAVGLGSTEFPFTIAGAEEVIDYQQAEIAAAKAADAATPSFKDVCVKGIISDILYTFSASYGTGTFWISDDGTNHGIASDHKSTTEPAKDFECYSVYWFGNQAWTDNDPQIAVGDEVIVKGQLTLYNTTYETSSKKAWVYSHNGNTGE